MKMKNSDVLSTIIRTKLGIAERVISLLPDEVKPIVKEAEKAVLTVVRDEIGIYLQKENEEAKNTGIKKVEVD